MITYRLAVPEDIPDLIRLRKTQLSDEGQDIHSMDIDHEMDRYFRDQFATGNFFELLGCDGEDIIATGAVIFFDFPPSYTNAHGRRAYIANMYTARPYRGKGIATEILTRLHDMGLARGIDKFFLIASPYGKPVYQRFGFAEDPTWLTMSGERPAGR